MDSLPVLPWRMILSYLDLRDLKSCSLIDKSKGKEASKFLYMNSKIRIKSESELMRYYEHLEKTGKVHQHVELNDLQIKNIEKNPEVYEKFFGMQGGLENVIFHLEGANSCSKISDQLLSQILDLCQHLTLILSLLDVPDYIWQFFASRVNMDCLENLALVYKDHKDVDEKDVDENGKEYLQKFLLSSPNLKKINIFFPDFLKQRPSVWPWPMDILTKFAEHFKDVEIYVAIPRSVRVIKNAGKITINGRVFELSRVETDIFQFTNQPVKALELQPGTRTSPLFPFLSSFGESDEDFKALGFPNAKKVYLIGRIFPPPNPTPSENDP